MPKKSRSTKGRRRNNRRKSTKNMLKKGGHHRIIRVERKEPTVCERGEICGYNIVSDGTRQSFMHDFHIIEGNRVCRFCKCSQSIKADY